MNLKYNIIFSCCLCCNFVFAQNNVKIYDLLNELKTTTQDTAKADIFVRLANEYYPSEADKAITKAELALLMVQNKKDSRRTFNALEILIRCHVNVKNNLQIGATYLSRIHTLDKQQFNTFEKAKLYSLEGNVYMALNDFAKSQKSFYEALNLLEKENSDDAKKMLANIYYNLGELYAAQNDVTNNILYRTKALDIAQQLNDVVLRVKSLDALATTYIIVGDSTKALQAANDALFLSESITDKSIVAKSHITLGKAQAQTGNIGAAIANIEKAIEIGNTTFDNKIIAEAKLSLGDIYLQKTKSTQALTFYREALDAALATNNRLLEKNTYEKLYQYFDKKDDTGYAHLYLKKLIAARDSLNTEEQAKQIIINKIRYDAEKKEVENQVLLAKQLEDKMIIQRQRMGNILLFLVILALGIGGYFLYRSLKDKKQNNLVLEKEVEKRTKELQSSNEDLLNSNKQLEQSNNELERFAYIASHDLKSPLRNIISFLNLIQRKLRGYEDNDLHEYLRFATENAKQMHVLIQDVLEFSKVDAEPLIKKERINLNESMMLVVQNLQETMKETNAEIIVEQMPVVHANSVHMLQLMQNLIGNGIKYNKNHFPKVEVSHNQVNGHHIFAIKDNGIGISKEYHDQIFEMFKRLHTRDEYKGTGIGLAICKKIVNSFGGRIWLDSEENNGTTFYFTLPCEN
jgi:signal transduction histidine kinase